MTADSGVRSPATGSLEKPSPPTGRRTASAGSSSAQAGGAKSGRKGDTAEARARRSRARTQALVDFDRGFGVGLIAGVDEAGRGCLAGPLIAAAVLLDYRGLSRAERRRLTGLDDSKRLDREQRERLYGDILGIAARVCVTARCARSIDTRGLHRSNLEALSSALEGLKPAGAICLVDGFRLPDCRFGHHRVVKGDATSAAIAAASIVAKVARDRHMARLDARHPGWGFSEHVGYATPAHREAIERLGPSPVHRLSFDSAAYAVHRAGQPA